MKIIGYFSFFLGLVLCGCTTGQTPISSPTLVAPTSTITVRPSDTPSPSQTPSPIPSETPSPTETVEPPPTATHIAVRIEYEEATVLASIEYLIEDLVWSPDGDMIYLATEQGLMAYDVESGERLYWTGNGLRLRTIAVSSDGERLAVGIIQDGTVRIVEAKTGELLQTFEGHTDWVQAVAFSPNGNFLVSGADDGQLLLWNVQSGDLIRSIFECEGWIWSVTYSPDGRYLIAACDQEIKYRIWETQNWTLQNEFSGDQATDIAISLDGSKLVSASSGWREVSIWNIDTGERLNRLEGHTGWISAVAYNPDGKSVASGGIGEVIILWDVETGIPINEFYTGADFIQSIEFSPDGSYLVSAGALGEVLLWPIQ